METSSNRAIRYAVTNNLISVDLENGLVYRKYKNSSGKYKRIYTRINSAGYNVIELVDPSTGRRAKSVKVHRIVAYAYFGEKALEYGVQVDHIGRNRTNNAISNLRLVTPRENMENRFNAHFRVLLNNVVIAYCEQYEHALIVANAINGAIVKVP